MQLSIEELRQAAAALRLYAAASLERSARSQGVERYRLASKFYMAAGVIDIAAQCHNLAFLYEV